MGTSTDDGVNLNYSGDIRDSFGYTVSTLNLTGGEGVYVADSDGNTYIDCASGTFNMSLGYQHPAVVKALKDSAERMIHVSSAYQADEINCLVKSLADLSPPNLTQVNLKVSGGSTANEGAIKLAQQATGNRDVITMFRSHHGQTFFTTAISGNAFRRQALNQLAVSNLIVPDPYCARCFYGQKRESCGLLCVSRIDDFVEFAGSGSVACVMVEPIAGNGGNIIPPDGYLAALREFCTERNIPLIFDEIQTGIGRLGTMFAADYFGVAPDIMTIGKGLGAGAQIAGILSARELGLLETDVHSFTFGANVMAAAAANAVLGVVSQPDFLANVRSVGDHVIRRLSAFADRSPNIFEVRGVGLMIGVEVIDDDARPDAALANEIAQRGITFGLLLRTSRYGRGNVVKVRPPLVMTHDEADLMCDRIEALLAEVLR
jgi:4-aminobutyrate aminotransferase-like enzyme